MADNETIKERLIFFIRHLNIGQGKFESRCGLANGYVNNIRRSITPDKLQQIIRQFPELNAGWLMTGEGEMLKQLSTNVNEVSGNENIVDMTVTQTIGENSGQNAGRDINNPPCPYGELHFMAELEAQRRFSERQLEVYSASLDKLHEQICNAQSQIEMLVKQNTELFNRFMSVMESMGD